MKLLQVALLIAPITLITAPAIAKPSPCAQSYMILPNGKCLDLSYTTVLGISRTTARASQAEYQELFNANVTLEMSSAYKRNETKEEQNSRYTVLANKKQETDKIESSAKKIEDLAYPLHLHAMTEVEKAFVLKR